MNDQTLLEQVEQARQVYLGACDGAAATGKEHGELRVVVGGNETERKAAAKRIPAEQYEALVQQFAAADVARSEAIAWRDRCEKDLNTLRDMLCRETADVEFATAVQQVEAANIAAKIAGTRPLLSEIRRRATVPAGAGMCADCGESMALDIHSDCLPF